MVEQRVHRDRDAGGDRATEVLAVARDDVEGGRRAEVDDDAGASVQVVRPDGVGDAICSHLLGVVVEDRHSRADAGFEHYVRHVEPPVGHLAQRRGDLRYRGGHPDAGHYLVHVHAFEVE